MLPFCVPPGKFFSTNQKYILPDLCSHRSSVWYFCHHSSEVILRKKQWWYPLWNVLCFEIPRLSIKGFYEIEGIMCYKDNVYISKQLFLTEFMFSISLQSFYQPSSYNWFICDCASWSFYLCWVGVWRISKARL